MLITSFKLKYSYPMKKADQIVLYENVQCEGLRCHDMQHFKDK